jgi:cystathionine beta-lyase
MAIISLEKCMLQSFDREIPREGTDSVKWEFFPGEPGSFLLEQTDRFMGEDRTLPMWVADMDFRSPGPVVEALVGRAQHGIYGYSSPGKRFYQAVVDWMARRQDWEVNPEWICVTPGVVPALNILVQTFVSPGQKVLIQPPVYHPFYMAIENNGAEVVANPLVYQDGRYRMDFDDLERVVQDPEVKMAILCSPHNPVGRVWTRDELITFGEICFEKDVLVVSDEIHGDLIYPGYSFVPFASLTPEFAHRSVICTAPSKTFNLAGLHTSCIIIPDKDVRSGFKQRLRSCGLFGVGSFGLVALQVAYEQGEAWLDRILAYIERNFEYLENYVTENIPQIDVVKPEGTYLVWLDCSGLGLDSAGLKKLMLEDARVFLDDGALFGPEGEGFQRVNIACPRAILVEALERMENAVDRL